MSFARKLVTVICCTFAITMFAVGVTTPAATAETTANKEAIESVIREFLMENPEVVVEAIQRYQEQQRERQLAEQRQQIESLRDQLERSATSPVGGNPDGDVVMVEFFDYRCGYCKRVHDTVVETVKADGNIRLVYKEYPILGPDSVFAAQAALGVFFEKPEMYSSFNDALMRTKGSLSRQRVLQIAAGLGLDPTEVETASKSEKVATELQANMELARTLSINGTPAFIVGNTVVPGAMDSAAMQRLIAEAREG